MSGVFNAVMVNGDFVGDTMFYGRGAGREATASAVSADVVDAALDLVNKVPTRIHSFLPGAEYTGLIPMDDVATRVYMRIPVQDKPGVLGKVATLLSSFGISVSELMQSSPDEAGNVSIILLSHMTREKNVQSAMSELARLSEVTGNVVMIRMEEL